MDAKKCIRCGTEYLKPSGVRGKRWLMRKYCTITCQRAATKQLGQKKNMSVQGRLAQSANGRRNIAKETPAQRTLRMKKVIESRNSNGIWQPPTLGKRGAERKRVWLGDKAVYNSKHRWIQINWIKTGICQDCGKKPRPFGNRKFGTEWANLDGEYNREDKETWKELCVPCHRNLDRPN